MPLRKLLFVDANIWLDFYRGRNETGLALLKHAESISNDIIVTYQLESEFKRNRHAAILEGMKELKAPSQIPRPGIFSDAQATRVIIKSFAEIEKGVKKLKTRLNRALAEPTLHDPVYQACQRIFHREESPIVLRHDNKIRNAIRRRAFRRFLHGYPPRKGSDISIGDAFNWEWMIYCAQENTADLVIVSRDGDYGTSFGDKIHVNDDLRQEFSDRVSKKRKLLLYHKLSDALKHFAVEVSPEEEQAESEIAAAAVERPTLVGGRTLSLSSLLGEETTQEPRFLALEALKDLYAQSTKSAPLGETEKAETHSRDEDSAEETE